MIYEIVVYTAQDEKTADAARESVRPMIEKIPGFRGFMPMKGAEEGVSRADIAIWDSLAAAKRAAQIVGEKAEFAPFLGSIAAVSSMGHFVPQWPVAHATLPGMGIEIGRFRLKPGIDEATARAAHREAVHGFISHQPGWVAQHMLRLADGTYVDFLVASSQARAKEICAMWHGQPACEAFVAMVDVVEMVFGDAMA